MQQQLLQALKKTRDLGLFARALLLACWPRRAHQPTLWISLSGGGTGSASDLRGRALAAPLRRQGWRVLVLPASFDLSQRRLLWSVGKPDVILFQQTRHPLNTPAHYPGTACLLDVDDADIINPAETQRIGAIAHGCRHVIAGSRHLASLFKPFNPQVSVVWTGTYLTQAPQAQPNEQRRAIVAWAPSDPFGYPAEMAFVRDTMTLLAATRPAFELRIYGVPQSRQADMAQAFAALTALGATLRVLPPMPYGQFIASLAEAAVGLQPVCESHAYSLGKSFGKVLAYLAADCAVVASNCIDHPLFFRDNHNGRLLDNLPSSWAAACGSLLTEPPQRQRMVATARADFHQRLSIDKAADLIHHIALSVRQASAATENAYP